jgi:protease-4
VHLVPPRGRWRRRFVLLLLFLSLLLNFVLLFSSVRQSEPERPRETFHSGDRFAAAKLAILEVDGTIMPPFTDRILRAIETAQEEEAVKGLVLAVDSPGGLVADSHEIYHALQEFRQKKPIVVTMRRMAASGGLYIAMGGGEKCRIYAEPTCWTGSIGVIIPRFEATGLAEKVGVQSEPLKTGPFKDALSPFRPLSDEERAVWDKIIEESFDRFIHVIADNRASLDYEGVKKLATGQIYTAEQAKDSGLIDEIGFLDDAIEDLKKQLQLEEVHVVKYDFPTTMLNLLLGSVEAQQPAAAWNTVLEATVPRAMYFCSWAPVLPMH